MGGLTTILVTGVSSGLGRAFAVAASTAGYSVIGTVRCPDQVEEFERHAGPRCHALALDLADVGAIAPTVAEAERRIAPIDILVNNAGYGVEGTFEETPLAKFREQFEVNVFGTVALTQAVLPRMRARRRGHIVFVTSVGGLVATPGLSAYHGSKFALEGIAAGLAQEVSSLGIHVTALEPGSFRTQWAGRSLDRIPSVIADYHGVFAPVRQARLMRRGCQPGDPVRAAAALVEILASERPPRQLVLGSDAVRLLAESQSAFDVESSRWRELSLSTDFPER